MSLRNTIQESLIELKSPVLIVSSFVGRGNYSIGEAFKEKCPGRCYHMAVEDLLPHSAVQEDLGRYQWISNNVKFLLYLIYTIPLFYHLKYIREKWFCKTDLSALERTINTLGVKTVICVSHRPAFWLSLLKTRTKLNFSIWGVLAEFGTNLGWQYISWESMSGFFSIMPKEHLRLNLPPNVLFQNLELPCRKDFSALAACKADKNSLLFVAGYWGQISERKAVNLINTLLMEFPELNVHIVCGTNETLERRMRVLLGSSSRVKIYGKIDSLVDLMRLCASIITKPGFSTLVEAYCAGRKIFLLKGMPVAEDHNAVYAVNHFSAEWYNIKNFKEWYIKDACV